MAESNPYPGFERHDLDEVCPLFSGSLPTGLLPGDEQFERLWLMHPDGYNVIPMVGRPTPIPRYQQAFERAYRFSGRTHEPLPAPPSLRIYLEWAKGTVDRRLNGILVNWYEGKLGHYIGAHRDSAAGLTTGVPIVTISLGEERAFRMRPWRRKGFRDFPAVHGGVFVLPCGTNRAWTHEVPHAARHTGRRISVTLRAFEEGEPRQLKPRREQA
jgi:alkylated DNA repair dioxygenase AlkB